LRSVALAGKAPVACRRILERRRPDVVLGAGGYVAGPMVFAAATRGIPAAIMEADAHLGLANRLSLPFARRVFLAFPIPGRTGSKYRVTGRPVPAGSRATPRDEGRRRFDLPSDGPLLLVYGGSQGARTLNELVVEAFADDGPHVLHLAGERDYGLLRDRVHREGYRLLPYTHEFGAALAASDLALARAGGSVYELAAAGTPAVLVPYPDATGDHQAKNARHFERAGAAVVVPEREARRAPALVRSLLADSARLEHMAAAMRRVARPHAGEEIADEVLALARA
jgi:UDP-N-acetylglucosamine--N-acetylmuramyl-(pentapeptide) pyrophosphoryl-undecaprenol N-acetylglucosamine transferase